MFTGDVTARVEHYLADYKLQKQQKKKKCLPQIQEAQMQMTSFTNDMQ
jgi:hypothetical protein